MGRGFRAGEVGLSQWFATVAGPCWILIVRAQPADDAARFLGGTGVFPPGDEGFDGVRERNGHGLDPSGMGGMGMMNVGDLSGTAPNRW